MPETKATGQNPPQMHESDVKLLGEIRSEYDRLKAALAKAIVGQQEVIERVMICLLAKGHALLMGVPGLAKTMLIKRLSETLSLDFSRIQFTPDLMPMDITGTDILQDTQGGKREFEFIKGPLFANIVLADEVNRAPAKTQAAMLEAMQEHRVTVIGRTYTLKEPFFVLATQNPVEQEGTYPLPEAQLDRFMFLIEVGYPKESEEIEIARLTTGAEIGGLEHLMDGKRILQLQDVVRRVPVPEHIYEYATKLVRKTRPKGGTAPDWLKPLVAWGAGPRAVQYLILGAKARAALHGSYMARLEDVQAVAVPVLGHRVLMTFAAESEGVTSKDVVVRLMEESPVS